MSGKSPLVASAEQRDGLNRLAVSANRAEADRARAILLSFAGWKSAAIGQVFGRRKLCERRFRRIREDTVRDRRSTFMRKGLAGIERHPAPGCSAVKAQAARELFAAWTLPRLSEEIERAPCIASRIHRCWRCCVKKGHCLKAITPHHTLKGRQVAEAVERSGRRIQVMKQSARAG